MSNRDGTIISAWQYGIEYPDGYIEWANIAEGHRETVLRISEDDFKVARSQLADGNPTSVSEVARANRKLRLGAIEVARANHLPATEVTPPIVVYRIVTISYADARNAPMTMQEMTP